MRKITHYLRKERGASSAEFALVVIPFSVLVFGIVALSMALYANQTLQYATEAAARYYSVKTADTGTVPTSAAVNTYGQQKYNGPMSPTFTASRGGCGPNGFQVYGTGSIPISVINTTLTLQAHACFP